MEKKVSVTFGDTVQLVDVALISLIYTSIHSRRNVHNCSTFKGFICRVLMLDVLLNYQSGSAYDRSRNSNTTLAVKRESSKQNNVE